MHITIQTVSKEEAIPESGVQQKNAILALAGVAHALTHLFLTISETLQKVIIKTVRNENSKAFEEEI